MATFDVSNLVPEGILGNDKHTVRIQWRGTAPETLGRNDVKRARELFGYTVWQWEDTDRSGTPCLLTRMDKGDRQLWLYATYSFTRVACKVCVERKLKLQPYAAYYVLIVGKGMNTTEPFAICETHLDEMRRTIKGSELTLHLSESLRIGQHD